MVATDPRLELVARLTGACGAEIARRDPAAAIPWPDVPTVSAMVAHLGGVHRWVTRVVRTRRAAAAVDTSGLRAGSAREWFEEGRAALLAALGAVPPDAPCWVIGGRTGTAAFWRRRMVHENAKHLIDLRASGGGRWEVAPELTPADYADGVDELLSEFLPRSRPSLARLPGAVVLQSSDIDRTWRIGADWTVRADTDAAAGPTRIVARSGDLALMLWERADPLEAGDRFRVRGDRACVRALRAAAVHPW